jgi:vacuolar-type H+-ATPase subunit B/Vma2
MLPEEELNRIDEEYIEQYYEQTVEAATAD